jgi:cysteine desulfuration protein SufE
VPLESPPQPRNRKRIYHARDPSDRRSACKPAHIGQIKFVTIGEKQKQLTENYSIIDDPQERLSAVVDDARKMPTLPEFERTEVNRIKGCISQAWIVAELRDGLCYFRSDADSPLVRGLLKLICELYNNATPAEVSATEPALFEELGLARNLSPTRLNGLRSVRAKIREFADDHLPE